MKPQLQLKRSKIIVKSASYNIWWGIYGFCEKTGWEDLSLFSESGERIALVCVNGKKYLQNALAEIKKDPEEIGLAGDLRTFLAHQESHYRFYYDEPEDDDFFEVRYDAPRNAQGIKPRFVDIWLQDDAIGLESVKSGVADFAAKFLGINDPEVVFENDETFEDTLKSFKENEELFGGSTPLKIEFSEALITQLVEEWGLTQDEVEQKLKKALEM